MRAVIWLGPLGSRKLVEKFILRRWLHTIITMVTLLKHSWREGKGINYGHCNV